ncbi:MAG: protein-glutamate O-methyltransferase CheR [Symbiobacteriaceae bacterium]|nr:protein-glutamate O-methyltransferase CheR [Symbiobacteriaceae bacterium]
MPERSTSSPSVSKTGHDAILYKFSDLLYQTTGIATEEKKMHLLQTKLDRLLHRKGVSSYDDYWKLINSSANRAEFQEFLDTMTTNTTEFFRENDHFEYIQNNFDKIRSQNPRIDRNREVVIWSSACSSGQEPVTIALVMLELLTGGYGVRILATDLDTLILQKAARGLYTMQECDGIPAKYLSKYFSRVGNDYQASERVLSTISYRQFNLMNEFSFRHGFDFIFCRNVMIYFDNQTQEDLINKFYEHLVPGGLFFMGHSESMVNKKHRYHHTAPAIWSK